MSRGGFERARSRNYKVRIIHAKKFDRYAEAGVIRPVKTKGHIDGHPIMGAQGITLLDIVVGGCGLAAFAALIMRAKRAL